MTPEVLLKLAGVAVQSTAYSASLGYIAWYWERRRGTDAFHLVVAFAGAVWAASTLAGRIPLLAPAAVLLGTLIAYAVGEFWPRPRPGGGEERHLVQVIVLASVALVAFDWLTAHTPVSVSAWGGGPLSVGVLAASVSWGWVFWTARSRAALRVRLGIPNAWAMEYWDRPLPSSGPDAHLAHAGCWVAVLSIPLATTGILSTTILKDVAVSVLLARVAGVRGPAVLLGGATTLGTLRTGVAYTFVGSAGPPLVEAVVFVSLLLWLRYRGSRTAWGESHER